MDLDAGVRLGACAAEHQHQRGDGVERRADPDPDEVARIACLVAFTTSARSVQTMSVEAVKTRLGTVPRWVAMTACDWGWSRGPAAVGRWTAVARAISRLRPSVHLVDGRPRSTTAQEDEERDDRDGELGHGLASLTLGSRTVDGHRSAQFGR
jgi:hypothetical protein